MAKKTVGYVVCSKHGALAQYRGSSGFYVLGPAGASRRYAKVFKTREDAKTAILADREYWRHVNPDEEPSTERTIVRLET